MNEAQAVKVHN